MITLAAVAAHSGIAPTRSHPELYDIATFAIAVVAIVIVRRALRARFAKRRAEQPPKD